MGLTFVSFLNWFYQIPFETITTKIAKIISLYLSNGNIHFICFQLCVSNYIAFIPSNNIECGSWWMLFKISWNCSEQFAPTLALSLLYARVCISLARFPLHFSCVSTLRTIQSTAVIFVWAVHCILTSLLRRFQRKNHWLFGSLIIELLCCSMIANQLTAWRIGSE